MALPVDCEFVAQEVLVFEPCTDFVTVSATGDALEERIFIALANEAVLIDWLALH